MLRFTLFVLACFHLGVVDAYKKEASTSSLEQRVSVLEDDLMDIKLMLIKSAAEPGKCECQAEPMDDERLKDMHLRVREYRKIVNRFQRTMASVKSQITFLQETSKEVKQEVCQSRFMCSQWSMWSYCTGNCGRGFQTRRRECYAVGPEPEIGFCKSYQNHVSESRDCLRDRECNCPNGYEASVYGFCFKLSLDFKTPEEAAEICSQDGGHLALMDSEEKHMAVTQVVHRVRKWRDVLVDGRRSRGTSDWLTWDNEVMTFFNWKMDQMEKDEDLCIVVCTNDYFWYRYPCKLRYHFLCEIDSLP